MATVCQTDDDTMQAGSAAGNVTPLSLSIHPSTERVSVLADWRKLEQKLGSRRLMTSADWTEIWLETYGDLVEHRFAALKRNGQTAGFCLVTQGAQQHDGPLPIRTIHLGTAGEPDTDSICVEYNGLLCHADDRGQFAALLVSWVDSFTSWDSFQLDGFCTADLPDGISERPEMHSVRKRSFYCDLARARSLQCEPVELLGSSMQRTIRRKLRPWSPGQLEWITDLPAALSTFDDLVQLHQQRWTALGEPGSYASHRFEQFHRTLIERLLPQGRVVLCRLQHEGQTAACAQFLIDGNRVLLYQGGWNPELQRLSPGFAIDCLCLGEACRRGYDAFDFLCGETEHKQRLSTDAAELVWLKWRRPRWRFTMLNAARQTRSALRRWSESLGREKGRARSVSP